MDLYVKIWKARFIEILNMLSYMGMQDYDGEGMALVLSTICVQITLAVKS